MIKRFKAGKRYIYLGEIQDLKGDTKYILNGNPHECNKAPSSTTASFYDCPSSQMDWDFTVAMPDFYRLKKVTAFESGKYYVWIGPMTPACLPNWTSEMSVILDKNPHMCTRIEGGNSCSQWVGFEDIDGTWVYRNNLKHIREIKGYTGQQEDSTTQALMKDIDFGCNEPQVKALVDRLVKHIKEASLEK